MVEGLTDSLKVDGLRDSMNGGMRDSLNGGRTDGQSEWWMG